MTRAVIRSARSERLARGEGGFALVELMVAIAILAGGVLALVSTFDSSRRLATNSERHDVASATAERELERITALPWSQIALATAPTQSGVAGDPSSYLVGGTCGGTGLPASSPCYQWDWSNAARVEPLVIDSANGDATANPQTWTTPAPNSGTRLNGQLFRFITWVADPSCTAGGCGGANSDKRITVGVTEAGMKAPIVISTVVRNPAGGTQNPLTNPNTTCWQGTTQVPCAQ